MPELTTPPLIMALIAVLSYLLGSIPFGIVITRACGLGDLRKIGSGNIGATNVLRTGSKPAAAATLILDAGKGGIAVLIAQMFGEPDGAQLAALCAFLGHLFPIFLGFKGGKGVATFLGTLLCLAWPVGLACCITWLVCAKLFRISSLSALISAATAPLWMVLFHYNSMIMLAIVLAGLVIYRHKDNINRLRQGTEPRIGQK